MLRIKALTLIANTYRDHQYRSKVKELIKKSKDYYSIIPSIQVSSYIIQIKIYFKKKQSSIFQLAYCPIRKLNLFNVQRDMISQLKYRFCFIIDGNEIIDPKYPYIVSNEEYYNVVNLKDIQDTELKLELNKDFLKCDFNYASDTTSGSSTEEEDGNSNINESSKIIHIKSKANPKDKDKDEATCNHVKPILKQFRSFKRNRSMKHVSFGMINICK